MYLNNYWVYMLICLILTIIIECTLAFVLKYRKTDLVIILLVQILTNPILNALSLFIMLKFGLNIKRISVVIMEILIVFIEGLVYKHTLDNKKINPYLLSLILNGTSYSLGLIVDIFL